MDKVTGAKWWKVDFHTHSPASTDYGKGPDQLTLRNRTPEEWLLDYMRGEVDCVFICDHNSGEWITPCKCVLESESIKQHPDFRELYLFPAVEISVNGGVHILALFDRDKSSDDIIALLGAVDYKGNRGDSDGVTTKSVTEVIKIISDHGGIPVPAHVDGSAGIFNKIKGPSLEELLRCEEIIAAEKVNAGFREPQLYRDLKLTWSSVLGSDSHHPDGDRKPGSCYTWVKMSEPSLDGIRMAFIDGELSLMRSDGTVEDPNAFGHYIIENMTVNNGQYIGKPQAECFEFSPWLSTVIGGRGTGKSTIIEFLRTALRRESEIPSPLKVDLDKYHKAAAGRNDSGLMTEKTALEIIYRKDGSRYKIAWDYAGKASPIKELLPDGTESNAEGVVSSRFPVRIYSQKQIFFSAGEPQSLMQIIDDAPEIQYSLWQDEWNQAESRYLSIRAKIREIQSGLKEEDRVKGELEDVKRKLAVFEDAGHAEILKSYQTATRQERAIGTWEESWFQNGEKIREFIKDIDPVGSPENVFTTQKEEDADLLKEITAANTEASLLKEKLIVIAGEYDALKNKWTEKRKKLQWQQHSQDAKTKYLSLKERLQTEKVSDPSEYGRLVQIRQTLEEKIGSFEQRRNTLKDLELQEAEVLDACKTLRREISRRRHEFLKQILADNPYVKIRLIPYGDTSNIESQFRTRIDKTDDTYATTIGTVNEGKGLLGKLKYAETRKLTDEELFTTFRNAIENGLDTIKDICLKLHQGYPLSIPDERFKTHLYKLNPEKIDRLNVWFPDDSLEVSYSSDKGTTFRPVSQGSPGQKTAALLAFLLIYGDAPLILDQPEDDLDSSLIYELVVTHIREMKKKRQIIIVTHNPNIVVNGDAEWVIALDVVKGQTRQVGTGSLQQSDIRKRICEIMEGGKDAFDLRYRRIRGGGYVRQ
jgi:hypothetical protein